MFRGGEGFRGRFFSLTGMSPCRRQAKEMVSEESSGRDGTDRDVNASKEELDEGCGTDSSDVDEAGGREEDSEGGGTDTGVAGCREGGGEGEGEGER